MAEWIEERNDGKLIELVRMSFVVMVVPLGFSARNTVGVSIGSVLVVYMNKHPRPSFVLDGGMSDGEPLRRVIRERFELDDAETASLATFLGMVMDRTRRRYTE
jgi:hypothetical protein